jgi:hypothetical protein
VAVVENIDPANGPADQTATIAVLYTAGGVNHQIDLQAKMTINSAGAGTIDPALLSYIQLA